MRWQVQRLNLKADRVLDVLYNGEDETEARHVYDNVRNDGSVSAWFSLVQVNEVEFVLVQGSKRTARELGGKGLL